MATTKHQTKDISISNAEKIRDRLRGLESELSGYLTQYGSVLSIRNLREFNHLLVVVQSISNDVYIASHGPLQEEKPTHAEFEIFGMDTGRKRHLDD